MKRILIRYSALLVIIIISVSISINRNNEFKPRKVYVYDVLEYYIYFPAYFIFGESSLESFKHNKETQPYSWTRTSPINKPVFKFTMGVAVLSFPFYLISYIQNTICYGETYGFEPSYTLATLASTVFYLLAAFYFLNRILHRYFNVLTTAVTMLILFGATHIAQYSFFMIGMSHTISFFLISAFIYYTIRWHDNPKNKYLIVVGILSGFIVLVRPANFPILLFFVLYSCSSFLDVRKKMVQLVKSRNSYFIPALLLLVIFPQLLYWKMQTGSWLYFSYSNERFFFNDPKIIEVFFSFRSGLLIYSPALTLAIVGMFMLKKRIPDLHLSIITLFILFTYIFASWWCWWYVGFGHRAFIDIFPIMSIPLAVIAEKILKKNIIVKSLFGILILLLIYLSVFQIRQYNRGGIHWDGMTKEAYIQAFLEKGYRPEYFQALYSVPSDKAIAGYRDDTNYELYETIYLSNTFTGENIGNWENQSNIINGLAHKGQYSTKLDTNHNTSNAFIARIGDITNEKPDSLILYSWCYSESDSVSVQFGYEIFDNNSKKIIEKQFIKSHATIRNKWIYSRISVPWPKMGEMENQLKIFIENKERCPVYIDDYGFSLVF